MDIMIAVAVGVFLLVAWTVGGWAIVRMGFTRDGDAARTPAHDDGARILAACPAAPHPFRRPSPAASSPGAKPWTASPPTGCAASTCAG